MKTVLITFWSITCPIINRRLHSADFSSPVPNYRAICFIYCALMFFQDDTTRVAIGDNRDYINASYIRKQVGDEEYFYISCQGPLPSTVTAFWQMIWQNKSDVIAMMTQEVERGRIKCHKYWPERLGTSQDAGGYQLHLENQQFLEYFHIKVIRMVEKQVGDQQDGLLWGVVMVSERPPPSFFVTVR